MNHDSRFVYSLAAGRWPYEAPEAPDRAPQQQHDYGDYPQRRRGQEQYEPQRTAAASDDGYQKLQHNYDSYRVPQDEERQEYDDESSLGSFGTFYSAAADYTSSSTSPVETTATVPTRFEGERTSRGVAAEEEPSANAVHEAATTPMPAASAGVAEEAGVRGP